MGKYSKEIINNYINGEDICEYDISLLEDDFDFMVQVFEECNDKNMYYYCGDKLKRNLEFIEYLINKFHSNTDFIEMITRDYLKDANEIEQNELSIILYNSLVDFDDSEYLMSLKVSLGVFYAKNMVMCEVVMDELNVKNSLGFSVILSEYSDSDIIKRYFAKRILNEIFLGSFHEFEKLVHVQCKNKDNIIRMGINKYLLNYIYYSDECLSGYVAVHLDLLHDFSQRLEKILFGWEEYERIKDKDKMEGILFEIDKFVSDNGYFWGKELQIYKYLILKFSVKGDVDLKYFDPYFEGTIKDIPDLNISNIDVESYRKWEKFLLRIKNYYCFDIEPDDYLDDEVSNNNKTSCIILKLDPKE